MKHEIYLRCHTRILNDKSAEKRGFRKPSRDLQYVLLLDTETSIDTKKSLNFGAYQFCEAGTDGIFVCLEEGLFYADDLDPASVEVLRKYVEQASRKGSSIKYSEAPDLYQIRFRRESHVRGDPSWSCYLRFQSSVRSVSNCRGVSRGPRRR